MSLYSDNFSKYQEIGKQDFDSFEDICKAVEASLDASGDYSLGDAIIVLGYSGNGKTTWINEFVKMHPEYLLISFDNIVCDLAREGVMNDLPAMVEAVGKKIEECASFGHNMIFDGRFLNLLTRCALTQTLHQYGYFIHAVDLTDDIMKTLPCRILECCSRDLGVTITKENIGSISRTPTFQKRQRDIIDFYAMERSTSCFEEQKRLGVVYLDIDAVISKGSVASTGAYGSTK